MKETKERWTCEVCKQAGLYLDQTEYIDGQTKCKTCAKKKKKVSP